MAELDNIRRIIVEDYKDEEKTFISKLANVLNPFMEQVHNAFDNRIDFSNLNQELLQIQITVDGSGIPVTESQFKGSQVSRAVGALVIKAENLSNTGIYANSAPFINFSIVSSGLYKINNISGLPSGDKFRLTLILFGN